MASIKVFGSPTSTEVARVLACLFEKDVEFQLIRVDAFKGTEKKPEYLKLQASGQALTYEEGKTTLVDSRAICRHISEKYAERGNKDLIGTGMLERASIEQWLLTEEQSFDPPASALVFHLALAPLLNQAHGEDEELVEESKRKLMSVLDIYEKRLGETRFLAGDKFTLADLSHLPNTQHLMGTKCASLFKGKERVSKWWQEISSRPSWRRVLSMHNHLPAAPVHHPSSRTTPTLTHDNACERNYYI